MTGRTVSNLQLTTVREEVVSKKVDGGRRHVRERKKMNRDQRNFRNSKRDSMSRR